MILRADLEVGQQCTMGKFTKSVKSGQLIRLFLNRFLPEFATFYIGLSEFSEKLRNTQIRNRIFKLQLFHCAMADRFGKYSVFKIFVTLPCLLCRLCRHCVYYAERIWRWANNGKEMLSAGSTLKKNRTS